MWEAMARQSFQAYLSYLGVSGTPVEFIDSYVVSDDAAGERQRMGSRPAFAELEPELLADLLPHAVDFAPEQHSLGQRRLQRNSALMFNLASYSRVLLEEFKSSGGRIEIMEFHSPADFARLKEKTLINATGYGARALFDEALVPVRGQLARGIPDPDARYGLFYKHVGFVPRRDGLVFQAAGENDYYGYGDVPRCLTGPKPSVR